MPVDTYIAVGDIHGCVKTLTSLLDEIRDEEASYVFLGDYIDRGPDSKGCIDVLMDFEKDHRCVFLRGNHEAMMLEALETRDTRLWMMNGCQSTLRSYHTDTTSLRFPSAHLEFIESTRFYFNAQNYFFVHAGLNADLTIAEALRDPGFSNMFLWNRSHFSVDEYVWEKPVIVGHTPVREPLLKDKLIDIDTGCVYKSRGYGHLTAIKLPGRELITQPCIDEV